MSNKLIEVTGGNDAGGTVTRLTVQGNKVSGYVNQTDSTMGISIPINGPTVADMRILDNEISDIPGQGTPESDDLPGVRNAFEIGGPSTDNGHGTLISGNKIYGVVTPMTLTGCAGTTVAFNDIVYFTSTSVDSKGVALDGASPPDETNQPNATRDLPANVSNTIVAFDAWVSGGSGANTVVVGSTGTITKDGTSAGTIPANTSIPGLGPGRAILDGKGGGDSVTVNGKLVVFTGPQNLSPLTIASGATVQVASHRTRTQSANFPQGVVVTQSLSIASGVPGGKLDLTNNSMILDYSGPVGTLVDDMRQHLLNGRLITSAAGTPAGTRLGYGDNGVLGKTTFAGQTVDASSLLVKFTYAGDTNLDGQVDITDLGTVATNWQTSGPWTSGDSDYSGFIDITDLGMLATNWQLGVGGPLGPQQDGGYDTDMDFWAIVDQMHLSKKQRDALAAMLGSNAAGPTL